MKRAIILKGRPGVGKTPILIAIYNWIKASYPYSMVDEDITTDDVYGIVDVGLLRIGLCSAGDDGSDVEDFLNECIANNCDIIIGACRTRGSTFDVVRAKLVYPAFVIDWVIPEWIGPSTNMAYRIATGIDEVQTRLRGLPPI